MYNRIPTILSVIFLGSMLLASSEGVTKKTINNEMFYQLRIMWI